MWWYSAQIYVICRTKFSSERQPGRDNPHFPLPFCLSVMQRGNVVMLKRKVVCLFWHREKHSLQMTEDLEICRFKCWGSESEQKATLNKYLLQVYFPSSRVGRSILLNYQRETFQQDNTTKISKAKSFWKIPSLYFLYILRLQ